MFAKTSDKNNRFHSINDNPNRLYNLYLCNYRAHQAKKSLNKFIENPKNFISSEALRELVSIRNQIKVLFEMEPSILGRI